MSSNVNMLNWKIFSWHLVTSAVFDSIWFREVLWTAINIRERSLHMMDNFHEKPWKTVQINIVIFRESSRTMVVTICQFPPSLMKICESSQVNSFGPSHSYTVKYSHSHLPKVARLPWILYWLKIFIILSLPSLFHKSSSNKLSMCTIECWPGLWMKGTFSNMSCQLISFYWECWNPSFDKNTKPYLKKIKGH